MHPIYQTVRLSRGHVTLRAWSATNAPGHLLDLLTLTATLGHIREEWQAYDRRDISPEVWGAFWRLVKASTGGEDAPSLPSPITLADRFRLLEAMWELNDVEEIEGKLTALAQRAARMLDRLSQGQMTTSTSS